MARPVSGKTRTSVVRVKQKNGDIYVYERKSKYDPAAGYTRNFDYKLIGKIPAGTSEMVPTRARKSPASSARAAENSSQEGKSPAGLSDILDWIGEKSGIDHDLSSVFGGTAAGMLIALARMMAAEGRFSYMRFKKWQMQHGSPFGNLLVSDAMCRAFLDMLGEQDLLSLRYFRARAARCSSERLAAMDITCTPEQTEEEESDCMSPSRLLTVCSMTSGQPVAFVRLQDELKDPAVIEAGFSDLGELDIWQEAKGGFQGALQGALHSGSFPVVSDTGLYDAGNVALYMEKNISFISGIILYTPWVYEALEAHRHELEKADSFFLQDRLYKACTVIAEQDFSSEEGRNAAVSAKAVSSKAKKKGRLYLHFYFDSLGCSNEKAALRFWMDEMSRQIEQGFIRFPEEAGSLAERLFIVSKGKNKSVQCNEKALLEEQKDYGIFCLASDTEDNPREALRYCLERNIISACFRQKDRSFDEFEERSVSLQASDGDLFVRFVALGYLTYFQEAVQRVIARLSGEGGADNEADRTLKEDLKDWLCECPPEEVLALFDSIDTLRRRPGCKDNPVWKEKDREYEQRAGQRAGLLEALLKEEAPAL